jgi:hypothetical protein
MRNVVKTIQELPDTFNRRLEVAMNDKEFDVTARNVILLLFACVSLDDVDPDNIPDKTILETTEIMIHLWYSAFLPHRYHVKLLAEVKPLIALLYARIADGEPGQFYLVLWILHMGKRFV